MVISLNHKMFYKTLSASTYSADSVFFGITVLILVLYE